MFRRARANEPEMVKVRAAESAGEEIIGQRVFLRPLPQRQLRAVVIAHDQGARIGRSDVAIEPATVDLLLVLVELVHQVARCHRQRQVDRRSVDAKRPVRQVFRKCRIGILAFPHRRQMGQRLAVVVDLRVLLGRRVGDAVRAGEQSVKIVEAAVLGVDHDDVLDLFQVRPRSFASAAARSPPARRRAAAARPILAATPMSHSGRPDAARQRRLPQLDLVAVGIEEPAEASVLVLLDFADHLPSSQMHLAERLVEVVDDRG